ALLRHLLAVELAYRRRAGERPTPGEYRARFPGHAAAVAAAFGAEAPPDPPPDRPPPGVPGPRAGTDRHLLLGVLALQLGFITRDAFVAAMNAWVRHKARPLGSSLIEQGALTGARRELLESLVGEHLRQHGADPGRSLAALSSLGPVRADLGRID